MQHFFQVQDRTESKLRRWIVWMCGVLLASGTVLGSSFVSAQTLTVPLGTNRATFVPGDSLSVSVGVDNPGTTSTVDFLFGAVLPDGDTVVLFTDLAFNSAVGSLSSPATLSPPIAASVDLTAPFVFDEPAFFTFTWTGAEPAGSYILFLAAVVPGALADNSIDAGDIVALSTATVVFIPPLHITSLSTTSAEPAQLLTVTGSGFDPVADLSVRFFDDQGFTVDVPVVEASATSLKVAVPPFFNFIIGDFSSGTANVQLVFASATGILTSNTISGFQINDLPTSTKPTGTTTINYLDQVIQLLLDAKKYNDMIEAISGGELSSVEMNIIIDDLTNDYTAVKNEVESIIADPTKSVIFIQINDETLQLDFNTLSLVDSLIESLMHRNEDLFKIEGLFLSEAMDNVKKFGGYVAAISSSYELFVTRNNIASTNLDKNINQLSESPAITCIIQWPKRINAALYTTYTFVPAVSTLYQNLNTVTAMEGINEYEIYSDLFRKYIMKLAPNLFDAIVPCSGTLLNALGAFETGPYGAYDIYLKYLEQRDWLYNNSFGTEVLPEERKDGPSLVFCSELCGEVPPPPPPPANAFLAVSVSPVGGGSVTGPGIGCPGDCTETYPLGTVVTLSASPADGFYFKGWSGACSGRGTCVLTMDADKGVIANFSNTLTWSASVSWNSGLANGACSPVFMLPLNGGSESFNCGIATATFTTTRTTMSVSGLGNVSGEGFSCSGSGGGSSGITETQTSFLGGFSISGSSTCTFDDSTSETNPVTGTFSASAPKETP